MSWHNLIDINGQAVIPDSVTSIGYSAFVYCSNLKEVRIKNPELMKNASADSAQIVRK